MRKRYAALAAILFVLLSSMVVSGQTESISRSFTLKHFDVTYTFPKTTKPGESVTVSASAVVKSSIRVVDLSIQVLAYMESGDLQSIGSASLAKDQYVSTGDRLSKDLSVTIPATTPRSELTAVFSETTSPTYSYYSYYYPSSYYYSYYYYSGYPYYWYYPYYYSYYYPTTASEQYVESKVLPCSYVLATTPEYLKLKSEYDTLSSQYNDMSARYQQATDQNRQLTEKLSRAMQDANNTRMLVYLFATTTVALAVFSVSFLLLYRRTKPTAKPTSGSGPAETKADKPKEDQPTP